MAVLNGLPFSLGTESGIKVVQHYNYTDGGASLPYSVSSVIDSYNADTNRNEPVYFTAFTHAWAYSVNPITSRVTLQYSDNGTSWQQERTSVATYPVCPFIQGIASGHRYYRLTYEGTMRIQEGTLACKGPIV